jgi:hypothetical protein
MSITDKQIGGNLGKFHPGDTAPPFDQAVFNQQNLINTTIGPIETSFGYPESLMERLSSKLPLISVVLVLSAPSFGQKKQ